MQIHCTVKTNNTFNTNSRILWSNFRQTSKDESWVLS